MHMAGIVLQQAFIMLILILIGAMCFKLKLLSEETVTQMSGLVLKVVNPVVIFLAYQRELEASLVHNLGWTFLLAAVSYAIAFAVAYLLIPDKPGRETVVERFSTIYSNCGFMGIPLVKAMFDYEGVFYLTAFITVFNALVWSHGVMQMSGQRSLKSLMKVLRSPAIIAIVLGMILFFSRISIPGLLYETLDMVGALNTPLAMFTVGIYLAQTDLRRMLGRKAVYAVSAVRLALIPTVSLLLLALLPETLRDMKLALLLVASCPVGSNVAVYAQLHGQDYPYAVETVVVSTLLSILTIPAVIGAASLIW